MFLRFYRRYTAQTKSHHLLSKIIGIGLTVWAAQTTLTDVLEKLSIRVVNVDTPVVLDKHLVLMTHNGRRTSQTTRSLHRRTNLS